MVNRLLRLMPFIAAFFLLNEAIAQTPQHINYQAVARNSSTGEELRNQEIFISLRILKGGPYGEIVYQEDHDNITTNTFGLFDLYIGGGSPIAGSFNQIDWGGGNHWLAIEIDAGNGMESMGAIQFVSVPYALHAETVSQIDDADADPTNELVHSIDYDPETRIFSLTQEGGTLEQDLSSLAEDADADPTNELVQAIQADPDSKDFTIVQELNPVTVNLLEFVKDSDSDPTNELVQDVVFDNESKSFTLLQQQNNISKDLSEFIKDDDSNPHNELVQSISVDVVTKKFTIVQESYNVEADLFAFVQDADNDPTNELITQLELVQDTILKIEEGENTHELDLSELKRDENWKKLPNGGITNRGGSIGIGTENPNSTLHIAGSLSLNTKMLTNQYGGFNYNIEELDNIIICKISNASTIHLYVPDANNCLGRMLFIRKTGSPIMYGKVVVHFPDNSKLDFTYSSITLDSGMNRETIMLYSMGADGWTAINRL